RRDLAEQRRPGARDAGQAPVTTRIAHVCARGGEVPSRGPGKRGPAGAGSRQGETQMIEAIQIAVDATQGNPAASPAAQPQTTMYEVGKFAEAYRGGGDVGNVG